MAKFLQFNVTELPELWAVGKEIRPNIEEQMKGNNPLPAFWGQCFQEDAFKALETQGESVYDPSYVGVMLDWKKGDGHFTYVIGMLMKPGANVPDGYVCRTLPAGRAAVGWIQGKDAADVCGPAHVMTEGALKAEGHSCDTMEWCMELYNCPRYTTPDANGDIVLDYYIPLD